MGNAGADKSDGLEIVSIGKLYTGPWEKKYWSSSRGKDRYPFPVEFSAVRTQNGITYKMEISEGLKGPLFTVSSSDGLSCSGRTPNVACESFQKKSSPQVKSCLGKRFSSKIDGLEFFGFKNAFVQRFLRELVANVGTNAANNLLPSICMDASENKDPIQPADTLPHLEKPQVRGRRSMKESVVAATSISKTVKGFPHQSEENIADAPSCKKRRQGKYNEEHSSIIPIQKRETKPRISSRPKKMKTVNLELLVEEQGLPSAKDDLPSDAFHVTDHLKVDECLLHEEKNPSSSGKSSTVKEDKNLPKEENPIDWKNVSAEGQSSSLVENKRTVWPKTVCLSELVALDKDSTKRKDVIASDASISHASNDKCELDKGDHDIPNSKLSILDPEAIPQIKTFSRRKRRKKNDEMLPEVSNPATTTEKTEPVASPVTTEPEKDPNVPQIKNSQISDKNRKDYIQIITVAPDSFDDHDTGCLGYTNEDNEDYVQTIQVAPDSFDGYDTASIGNSKPNLLPEDAVEDLTLHQNKKDHEGYIQSTSVAPDSFDGYDTGSLGNTKPELLPKNAVDDPTLHQHKKDHEDNIQATSVAPDSFDCSDTVEDPAFHQNKKGHQNYIQSTSVAPDSFDGYDTGSLGNTKPELLPNNAVDDPTLHQHKKDHEYCIQAISVAPNSFDGSESASLGNAVEDPALHQNKRESEDYIQTTSVAPDGFDGCNTGSLGNTQPKLHAKNAVDDIPTLYQQKKDCEENIQAISVAPDGYGTESLENTKPHLLMKDAVDDPTRVCPDTCPSDSCIGLVEDSVRDTETIASKKDTCSTSIANSSKNAFSVRKENACGDQDLPDSDIPDPNLVCPDNCPDDAVESFVKNTETTASKTHIPCATSPGKDSLCVGKEPKHGDQDLPDVVMPASYPPTQRVSYSNDMSKKIEVKDISTVDGNLNLKHESGLEDLLKLVACYNHPALISSVLLSLVGNNMYVCVLSGSSEKEDKTLFVYSTPITGEKRGRPFFVGYASVNLPNSEDAFGNKVAMDSSTIQFTPDGQDLVLLNSIRVPCCREKNMSCPCQSCASDCIEKNAIKIVQLHAGYVSIIIKLKTVQPVRCILVCEPYYLIAMDDNGKLHMWVMNSRWSAEKDECALPLPDNMASQLVEIKKIPQSPGLIIGHNGFGEFYLWNIEKRKLVSRFSVPDLSIQKCVPICLFDWKNLVSSLNEHDKDEVITNILDATKMRLLGSDIQPAQPTDNNDGAVWVLLSTASHADAFQSGGHQINSTGCWRLALLSKDTVVVGSPLDISATAAGTAVGHGVIGRSDGVVYMWELSTGLPIGDLHHFKGSGVSCIATDSSNSALAIASEGGQLLVYLNPRRASAKV